MRWNPQSNVGDVLALGPRTAGRLATVGIATVSQLLAAKPEIAARRVSLTAETVATWQREATLLLTYEDLSAESARLLAATGFSSLESIAHQTPTELLATLEVAQQKQTSGWFSQAILPTISEVSFWIQLARNSKNSRAA